MSLYSDDMTKEEVMKEAVRILAPTLRRMCDEYVKKEKEEVWECLMNTVFCRSTESSC